MAEARVLNNRYTLEAEIGRGGMGVVYRAADAQMKRTVAIKTLPSIMTHNPELMRRFNSEVQYASKLSHPNIARVYDVGENAGTHYYVMQYIDGKSLRELLKEKSRLTLEEALSILEQVASALDYAHSQGIVHRDIKPENILLDQAGNAFVVDFGIAKAAEGTRTTRGMLGTPEYMSPEQIRGEAVDGRSDQYSLAVVAYEMLTGQTPFQTEGDDPWAQINQHLSTRPPNPQSLQPSLPMPACNALLKGLEKESSQRFDDNQQLIDRISGMTVVASPRKKKYPAMWLSYCISAAIVISLLIYFGFQKNHHPIRSSNNSGKPVKSTGSTPCALFIDYTNDKIPSLNGLPLSNDKPAFKIIRLSNIHNQAVPNSEVIILPEKKCVIYVTDDFRLKKVSFNGEESILLGKNTYGINILGYDSATEQLTVSIGRSQNCGFDNCDIVRVSIGDGKSVKYQLSKCIRGVFRDDVICEEWYRSSENNSLTGKLVLTSLGGNKPKVLLDGYFRCDEICYANNSIYIQASVVVSDTPYHSVDKVYQYSKNGKLSELISIDSEYNRFFINYDGAAYISSTQCIDEVCTSQLLAVDLDKHTYRSITDPVKWAQYTNEPFTFTMNDTSGKKILVIGDSVLHVPGGGDFLMDNLSHTNYAIVANIQVDDYPPVSLTKSAKTQIVTGLPKGYELRGNCSGDFDGDSIIEHAYWAIGGYVEDNEFSHSSVKIWIERNGEIIWEDMQDTGEGIVSFQSLDVTLDKLPDLIILNDISISEYSQLLSVIRWNGSKFQKELGEYLQPKDGIKLIKEQALICVKSEYDDISYRWNGNKFVKHAN